MPFGMDAELVEEQQAPPVEPAIPPADSEMSLRQTSPIYDLMKKRGEEVYAEKTAKRKRSILGTIVGGLDPEGKVGQQLFDNRMAKEKNAQDASEKASQQVATARGLEISEKELGNNEKYRAEELAWRKEESGQQLSLREKELLQNKRLEMARQDIEYLKMETEKAMHAGDDKRIRDLSTAQIEATATLARLERGHESGMQANAQTFQGAQNTADREQRKTLQDDSQLHSTEEAGTERTWRGSENDKDRATSLLSSQGNPDLLKYVSGRADAGQVKVTSPGGMGYGGRNETTGSGRLQTVDDFITAGEYIPEQAIARATSDTDREAMLAANEAIAERKKIGYKKDGEAEYKGTAPYLGVLDINEARERNTKRDEEEATRLGTRSN